MRFDCGGGHFEALIARVLELTMLSTKHILGCLGESFWGRSRLRSLAITRGKLTPGRLEVCLLIIHQ